MKKSTNKKRRNVPHRVIGKIKKEDIPVIEDEHILISVPKSAWQRFTDWLEGN